MTPYDLVLTPRGLRFMGRLYPCSIGKGGPSPDKHEGDGATPCGVHRIVGMLYRPDRMPAPAPWAVPIGPRDLWSDDPTLPGYNRHVKAPFAGSHERLRRADPLYDLVLLTDWNWSDAQPGRGSAIFIHQWRRPGFPTEGCLGLSRQNLRYISTHIGIRSRFIVPPFPAPRK